MTKATALGFIDEKYDRFMAYNEDRELLHATIDKCLDEHGLERESKGELLASAIASDWNSTNPEIVSGLPEQSDERLLLVAAIDGRVSAVDEALRNRADIDARLESGAFEGCTPLIMALLNKHDDVARMLIERGADVNARRSDLDGEDTDRGQTALWWAAAHGHSELTAQLLAAGADVNQPDHHGSTPLCQAASGGHSDVVALLLQSGADIDSRIYDGRKAIHLASEHGYTAVVLTLIRNGSEPDDTSPDGSTPLLNAVMNNHGDLVQMLISAGASVDQPCADSQSTADGWTPLMFSVQRGFTEIAKMLIEAGANVNYAVNDHRVFSLANGRRANQMRTLLREAGAM